MGSWALYTTSVIQHCPGMGHSSLNLAWQLQCGATAVLVLIRRKADGVCQKAAPETRPTGGQPPGRPPGGRAFWSLLLVVPPFFWLWCFFVGSRVCSFGASLGCSCLLPPCSLCTWASRAWTKWCSLKPCGRCLWQSGHVHARCSKGRCSAGIMIGCCVRRTFLHGSWIRLAFRGITGGGASLSTRAVSSASSFG